MATQALKQAKEALEANEQCINDFIELYKRGCANTVMDEAVKSLRGDALNLTRSALAALATVSSEAPPSPVSVQPSGEQREKVMDAIAEALGGAMDCLRVWSAWGVGTMGPDDFASVAEDSDRLAEITDAAIKAILSTQPAQPISSEAPDRIELQAKGKHPAPCARHCEANAFNIEIRQLKAQLAASAALATVSDAQPVDVISLLLQVAGAAEEALVAHITPWEERKYVGGLVRNNEECMFEEINELRATVAQAAPSVPDGYIRFDYINADGREDSKVITHDEMRDRYAQHYRAAYANFAAPSAPSVPDRATMIERMKAAIEGECDGLAIDDKRAAAILDYVIAAAPSAPPAPDGLGKSPLPPPIFSQEHSDAMYRAGMILAGKMPQPAAPSKSADARDAKLPPLPEPEQPWADGSPPAVAWWDTKAINPWTRKEYEIQLWWGGHSWRASPNSPAATFLRQDRQWRGLAAVPAAPSVIADPLQELADQAQELDMGYGPNACPTCGKSAAARLQKIASLAQQGMCHGLLADDYCRQIAAIAAQSKEGGAA